MLQRLDRFLLDQNGTTAIEYALIASLITLAIIGVLTAVSGSVASGWKDVAAKIVAAVS